ncbi:hypothetical protein ACLBWX_21570 [Methylobacterium sp. M6A4_1b]
MAENQVLGTDEADRAQQGNHHMYPRQQSSSITQRSGRSTIIVDHQPETFRPVALPALAAAVQAVAATPKSARTRLLSSAISARFEHEDTPLS